MPCRVELTEGELEAARRARTEKEIAAVVEPLQKRNDELTHENDQLREIILRVADKDSMPADLYNKIREAQVEHRKEDLRRLEKHFRNVLYQSVTMQGGGAFTSRDFSQYLEKLRTVLRADPEKPLEEQLGFDPDSY